MPRNVKVPPPGAPPQSTQQAVAAALSAEDAGSKVSSTPAVRDGPAPEDGDDDDLLPEDQQPLKVDEGMESVPMMLSPADRKRLLGRLAEFELMLLGLTPSQQQFVMGYIMDPTDGAKAARQAGYSEKRAATTACDLLKRPKVAACVALGEQLREDRTMITSDRTLHELAIIAFSDITDFEVGPGGKIRTRPGVPSYATRAISSVEWTSTEFTDEKGNDRVTYKTKIKLWSKDTALRMLAVYQKLLSGEAGAGLVVNVNNDNRGQSHTHNHLHQTWQIGDRTLTF